MPGIELATRLILDICGGEASEIEVAGAAPDAARSYRLDTGRLKALVGLDLAAPEQARILTALGFTPEPDGDAALNVGVPSWRPDVLGEADLVEEIARIASLSNLQGAPMTRSPGVAAPVLTPIQRRESDARRRIAAAGFNECVTYSFIDETAATLFGGGSDAVRLENPISSEMSHMRPDLLPGLLRAAARNQARGQGDLALFEVGQVFPGGEPGEQRLQAAGIRVGHTAPRDALGARRPVDLWDARTDAEAALAAIGAPASLMVLRSAPGWLHPGRSAVLSLGPKNPLAVFGEVHPRVLAALDLRGPAVAFTLHLDAVPFPKSRTSTRPALDASDLPAVERDFAFVLDARVEAEAVLKAARAADKALITQVSVFDIFAGPRAEAQMGPGKKSMAIAVRLQPTVATLTEAEIEAVSARVVAGVAKATGGALRT